jgi:hypothetical protein
MLGPALHVMTDFQGTFSLAVIQSSTFATAQIQNRRCRLLRGFEIGAVGFNADSQLAL